MTIRLPVRLLVPIVFVGMVLGTFGLQRLLLPDSGAAVAVATYLTILVSFVAASWLGRGRRPPVDTAWLLRRGLIFFAGGVMATLIESDDSPLYGLGLAGFYVGMFGVPVVAFRLGRRKQESRFLSAAVLSSAFAAGLAAGTGEDATGFMIVAVVFTLPISLAAVELGSLSRKLPFWRPRAD